MKLIHPTTENSVPGDIKYEDLKDLCWEVVHKYTEKPGERQGWHVEKTEQEYFVQDSLMETRRELKIDD
jgi:hypothetical protein